MDTIPERIGKDDPLLAFFQGAGRHNAPADLEGRVLQQLGAVDLPLTPQASLISPKGWAVIAAIAAAILLTGSQLASAGSHDLIPWSEIMAGAHWNSLKELFTSGWVMAMVAGIAVLTALDRLLAARAITVLTR